MGAVRTVALRRLRRPSAALEIAAEPVPAGTVSGEGRAGGARPAGDGSEDFSDEAGRTRWTPAPTTARETTARRRRTSAAKATGRTRLRRPHPQLRRRGLRGRDRPGPRPRRVDHPSRAAQRGLATGGIPPGALTSLPPDAEGLSAVTARSPALVPEVLLGSDVVSNVAAWRDRLWKGEAPGALALQGGSSATTASLGVAGWCAVSAAASAVSRCGRRPVRSRSFKRTRRRFASARTCSRRPTRPRPGAAANSRRAELRPRRLPRLRLAGTPSQRTSRGAAGLFDLLALDEAHGTAGTARRRSAPRTV